MANADPDIGQSNFTSDVAGLASRLEFDHLDPDSLAVAKQCLMDWFAVAIAGASEPLSRILAAEAREEGGAPQATIFGTGAKGSVLQAALINGAASHALDYDDVNRAMGGHPTVPVAPAVLALGEYLKSSGRDLLTAFVAGYEAECHIGQVVMPSHYQRGFHTTGTVGAFGAVAGAARLLGLDPDQTAMAFGIAGTQAAGLKAHFGTMSKPLHAGKAAENGLRAAKLAKRGFTSRSDILETAQGFVATQCDAPNWNAAMFDPPRGFYVRENLFKYHAACYLTHSTIGMLQELRNSVAKLDDVQAVTLEVDPGHLKVCNIEEPATGLEVKFSLRHTAALALSGQDTANPETYSEAVARRPDLVELRRKVTVEPTGGPGTLASVSVALADGSVLRQQFNVGIPADDVSAQGGRIAGKFKSLCRPVLGEDRGDALLAALDGLEDCADVSEIFTLLADWKET